MKYQKIKKNADYQRVFKRGKKVYSAAVTVVYFPCTELKMGIVISKKYGKAVRRNRIKRLLRQAFYNTCGTLQKPYAVILLPKISEEYSLAAFEQSLTKCMEKINKCA
ncbi:MAG: ribonuclease P protein component [Clostridia bacterium]|nr:ribonuclease P protein component [Clostridia bacterium]